MGGFLTHGTQELDLICVFAFSKKGVSHRGAHQLKVCGPLLPFLVGYQGLAHTLWHHTCTNTIHACVHGNTYTPDHFI